MRYLCIGLVLLFLVGILCIINDRLMDRQLGEIEALIEDAISSGVDVDTALDSIATAEELWNRSSKHLTSVLIHSNVDSVQQRIRVASSALMAGEPAAAHLAAALEAIRSLRES